MASAPSVVVIETDPNLAAMLAGCLREGGLDALVTDDVDGAVALCAEHDPALVIIDVDLGERDGRDVCRALRAKAMTPVLFLTARDGEIDHDLSIELIADDYITKPFSARSLLGRVQAILRRGELAVSADDAVVPIGDVFTIDIAGRTVTAHDETIELSTREFDLLAFLALQQGRALTRQQLLDGVWGADWYGDESAADVHVRQLRRKLGDELPLAAVWGVGYRMG